VDVRHEERNPMKTKILSWLLIAAIVVAGLSVMSCGSSKEITLTSGDGTVIKFKDNGKMPPMLSDTGKKYTATIETAKGNLVLELFAKDVPRTASNFVYLAMKGFYDGTTFHRVIPGFMAQGGDPTGTGSGNPGYFFANEITAHKHVAGALSMANSGPNTNGSQFFITYVATPWLDGSYNVFGQLVEGMDVLKQLTPRDPDQNPKFPGDKIIKVTIKVQ
jgi:peptidylprolyl isomerase/peptidyl-prolyl cis-trans isomerase B (cyclophilin B)